MALKSDRSKGADVSPIGASERSNFVKFTNKYMLAIIAVISAIYLAVYPDVLSRFWKGVTAYSGETASAITFESLFQAVLFLLCASCLGRKGKNLFEKYVLSKLEVDTGVKHTISTLLGYVICILICLISLAIVGINLKNLAIVFGALSVGIGFGLQNVVNNFISGLIILFERPIKEGDWVLINGQEGIVKNIRIRATELETFNKASILIPNAEIISGNVLNWTHSNMNGRVEVPIRVSYHSDLNKIKCILLDVAKKDKRLLKNPAPYVWVLNFGESAIELELRAITSNVMDKGAIRSDLMFQIFDAFRQENIEIPYPKHMVYLLDEDTNA